VPWALLGTWLAESPRGDPPIGLVAGVSLLILLGVRALIQFIGWRKQPPGTDRAAVFREEVRSFLVFFLLALASVAFFVLLCK
jgi:hypothetical protein